MPAAKRIGPLVREWRRRRRRSQMDLALDIGVSPRHLSFVESGRSNPSVELLMTLADRLEIPHRERNGLLLAAGYAPRYSQTAFDDPALASVRSALQRLLNSHDPYPGIVIDRLWNAVLMNVAAEQLAAALPSELKEPRLNVFRACLHPKGLAAATLNFAEWAGYLLNQLHRIQLLTADPEVVSLLEEVTRYPSVAVLGDWRKVASLSEPVLLVPWRLRLADAQLSLFTTVTSFGTPQDITLSELAVELFYPADDFTEAVMRQR